MTRLCWLFVAIMTTAASSASAQTYPAKPVRIITAAAGGGSDHSTRLIATPLGAALGQQVIVDNRGLLAADIAAKAPPDGYTLLLSGQTCGCFRSCGERRLQHNRLTPITTATEAANILAVHPTLPAKSVKDWSRSRKRGPVSSISQRRATAIRCSLPASCSGRSRV